MHVRCHAVSHPSHRIIPVSEYAPQAEQASVDKYSWRVMLIMFISCSMHLPSSTGSSSTLGASSAQVNIFAIASGLAS